MKIRSYRPEDEEGWVRCRVLAFLHTAYFDNVLQQKERYDNPSIELVAEVDGQIVGLIDIELENDTLRTALLFAQTARETMKYSDSYLFREAGVSLIRFIVLQALGCNEEGLKPTELADWTQTERHNITTLIDRMTKDGLITVRKNPHDKRSVIVNLTDKGRELLKRSTPVAVAIVDQMMSSISEKDTAILEKIMRVMRRNAHQGLVAASNGARKLSE